MAVLICLERTGCQYTLPSLHELTRGPGTKHVILYILAIPSSFKAPLGRRTSHEVLWNSCTAQPKGAPWSQAARNSKPSLPFEVGALSTELNRLLVDESYYDGIWQRRQLSHEPAQRSPGTPTRSLLVVGFLCLGFKSMYDHINSKPALHEPKKP